MTRRRKLFRQMFTIEVHSEGQPLPDGIGIEALAKEITKAGSGDGGLSASTEDADGKGTGRLFYLLGSDSEYLGLTPGGSDEEDEVRVPPTAGGTDSVEGKAERLVVWAQIERLMPGGDFEDVGEPVTIGTFDRLPEAGGLLAKLSADGYDSRGWSVQERRDLIKGAAALLEQAAEVLDDEDPEHPGHAWAKEARAWLERASDKTSQG